MGTQHNYQGEETATLWNIGVLLPNGTLAPMCMRPHRHPRKNSFPTAQKRNRTLLKLNNQPYLK